MLKHFIKINSKKKPPKDEQAASSFSIAHYRKQNVQKANIS